jgi:hypothetical protein
MPNLAGAIVIFGAGLIVLMYAFPSHRDIWNDFAITAYGTIGVAMYSFSK